ncbi:MAG TPA: type II toxin-antitoxin system mRNA interferase toxin, RelE/StbE family [Candidatus Nanoarchaeia archaeon]|nr:type II toxin-antitoxin system mRNA interferase toxin, RelE/StbE family [Candidatus Nanoarchaeia archaeon]
MYRIFTSNNKVKKKLSRYIAERKDIPSKLDRLKTNPRNECGAHPLRGKLKGKWACWLSSNIRMIYIIDDKNQIIFTEDVGTHKIYQ